MTSERKIVIIDAHGRAVPLEAIVLEGQFSFLGMGSGLESLAILNVDGASNPGYVAFT